MREGKEVTPMKQKSRKFNYEDDRHVYFSPVVQGHSIGGACQEGRFHQIVQTSVSIPTKYMKETTNLA